MTTYTLADPIPTITDLGAKVEGVSTAGGVSMWKDGSSVVHILGAFGESGGWFGHYINTTTDAHALVTGATVGCLNAPAYHPTQNKVYIGTGYAPTDQSTLIELDVTTTPPTVTKIKDQNIPAPIGDILIGSDNLVYYFGIGNIVYSYNPTVGMPTGWKSYGVVLTGLAPGSNYRAMAVDSEYIYCGVCKVGGSYLTAPWTLAITPTTGDVAWDEWEFGEAGDKQIWMYQNTTTLKWMATRRLADNSDKYYYLNGGTYTEVDYINNPAPEFIWDAQSHAPVQATLGSVTPFLRKGADDDAFPSMLGYYDIDADFSVMYPSKTAYEQSTIYYRPEGSTDPYTESTLTFTGPWAYLVTQAVGTVGNNVFGVAAGYSGCFDLDSNFDITYKGFSCHSPYASLNLPDGKIVVGGYSSRVFIYDPGAAWTLTMTNSTPVAPTDPSKPNPYFIIVDPPILHYRHGFDYDVNGLLWIGGNTARGTIFANVCWYNIETGVSDYVFDDWQAAATPLFRNLCAAVSRTKIVVSGNNGYIYVVDAATKALEGSYNLNLAGAYAYMVEVSHDRVMGITTDSKVFLFKPSDRTMVTAPQTFGGGITGSIFGLGNRMLWQMVLGPDGYVWMYVGNVLYRIHPTTLVFSAVGATGTYGKITFTNGNRDLFWYGNTTSVKYYNDIFNRVDDILSKRINGAVARKVSGAFAEKVNGVQQ